MDPLIIAYDLGTGGNKASLFDLDGNCLYDLFVPYPTHYPRAGWHEQRPEDWWSAIVESTRQLVEKSGLDARRVTCLGISGHSLGAVPLDKSGNLLRKSTPIWSDARPVEQTREFFRAVPESEWYSITGNGFPAPLYTVFKIMWYRDYEPEMFQKIDKIIGTKDYINYRLTGEISTDYSYASGCGVYNLLEWDYSEKLIGASGLPSSILPEIIPSSQVIGTLLPEAARVLGLSENVKVVSGGVDNSCMALGARNIRDGTIYNSLGSSSWIAVTSRQPVLDEGYRPFVFTAVIPELFNSAIPVFSSGTSFRWLRDQLCRDLLERSQSEGLDIYELMTSEAATSPAGARGILFNPNLGGGSSIDDSINIRGAYLGLDLGHQRADVIRATMEGVAMEMRMALDELHKTMSPVSEMVVVGGGSRSVLWRQIYADLYRMRIVKTNIDQQCAALGAAALAAVGSGYWKDYEIIDRIHVVQDIADPIAANVDVYEALMPLFRKSAAFLAELGDQVAALDLPAS